MELVLINEHLRNGKEDSNSNSNNDNHSKTSANKEGLLVTFTWLRVQIQEALAFSPNDCRILLHSFVDNKWLSATETASCTVENALQLMVHKQ